jgi:large subunit ribosomal protein L24
MNKLLKGDEVLVIAGKDKGKKGVISSRVGESHLVVDGINIVKKHQKPNPNNNQPGGIVEKTMPIHLSNVAIYNPDTKKRDRVTIKKSDDGKKIRVFTSSKIQIQSEKK